MFQIRSTYLFNGSKIIRDIVNLITAPSMKSNKIINQILFL